MNDQEQTERDTDQRGEPVSESALESVFDTADTYQQTHDTEYQRHKAYRKARQEYKTCDFIIDSDQADCHSITDKNRYRSLRQLISSPAVYHSDRTVYDQHSGQSHREYYLYDLVGQNHQYQTDGKKQDSR